MTWYSTENPKVTTNKLLEVMNEVSKAIGHKINTETYCISMHLMEYLKEKINKKLSCWKLYQDANKMKSGSVSHSVTSDPLPPHGL